MPDSFEMLLNSILQQSQSVNIKIEKLSTDMIDKDTFKDYQVRLDKRLESVDKELDTAQVDISAINSKLTTQDAKLQANTTFITNISSGGKWFFRVVFVAFLGVATSILPSYFANMNKQSTTANVTPQFMTPVVLGTSTPSPLPSGYHVKNTP